MNIKEIYRMALDGNKDAQAAISTAYSCADDDAKKLGNYDLAMRYCQLSIYWARKNLGKNTTIKDGCIPCERYTDSVTEWISVNKCYIADDEFSKYVNSSELLRTIVIVLSKEH